MLFGCGGGENGASTGETPAAQQAQVPMPPGSATISGTVSFAGAAPERKQIRQDRECSALHEQPVLSEDVIVNENGTLRNAFVYVKEGLGDAKYPVPSAAVTFDQRGCMYTPHVFGVQVGQSIKILNSDELLHNIHALPEVNRPFNFGMPKAGDEREREFRAAEVMVKIKCDVHPWMGAWAGVLEHPFYAVTGDDGTFSMSNLPAGEYVVEVWHETYGTKTGTVTVDDAGAATIDFSMGPDAA